MTVAARQAEGERVFRRRYTGFRRTCAERLIAATAPRHHACRPPRKAMRMGRLRGLVWLLALTGASHIAAYHSVEDDFAAEEGRAPVRVSLPGEAGALVQPTKLVVMLHGFSETGGSSQDDRIFPQNHAFLVRAPTTARSRSQSRVPASGANVLPACFRLRPADRIERPSPRDVRIEPALAHSSPHVLAHVLSCAG